MSSSAGPKRLPDPGVAAAAPPGAAAQPVVGVVTADASLLATLRDASPGVTIAAIDTPADLAQLLVDRGCSALFVGLDTLGDAAARLLPHLARQFPDLPLVAVGTRADEPLVARMITSGEVYRFLHVPLSHERARTFVATALRRSDELRAAHAAQAAAEPEVAPAPPPPRPPAPRVRDPYSDTQRVVRPRSNLPAIAFAGATLALAAFAGVTYLKRPSAPVAATSAGDPLVADLVGAANAAAAAGELLAPIGSSAADLYREALDRRPGDTEARAALLALADRMLGAGERALAAGQLGEAETAADTVALVRPREPRVAALRTAIERARAARVAATLPTEPPAVRTAKPGRNTDERAQYDDAREPVGPLGATAPGTAIASGTPTSPGAAAAPIASAARGEVEAGALDAAPTVRSTDADLPSTDPARRSAAAEPPLATTPVAAPTPAGTALPSTAAETALPSPSPPAERRAFPRKLVDVAPVYPPRARKQNVEGWVDVAFTIDADGRTVDVRVISAQPVATFDDAALEAVRHWRYAATPVPQAASVRLRFRLER